MPAPPSSKQRAQNAAAMGGGNQRGSASTGKVGVSSGKMGAASSQSGAKAPSKTGSGQIGSKGGGASQQRPGAGQNPGRVTASTLGAAKTTAQQARTTALGKVSQAANSNLGVSSGKMGAGSTQAGINRTALRAPNGSYYGPKGGTALNNDARMAAARSLGFSQPALTRTPGDAEMLGRMMMAESGSIRNRFGLPRTDGLQGVADVVRNRMLSDRFPDTVPSVLTQRKQFSPIADGSFRRTPANPMATRIAEAVLSGEQAPVVGNALNYANIDTVNRLPGYSSTATRRAFNSMRPDAVIADARNPTTRSHTFGTIGRPSDVSFAGPPTPSAPALSRPIQMASVSPTVIPRPTPRPVSAPIPRPTPRPNDLFTGNISQNPFDTQRTVGVPRARPPGVGPERIVGVENYIDPTSTITRNPYEQRVMDMYSGYGAFNTPRPTASLSRPAYESRPPASYSGFGNPFATLPAAPQKPARLTPQYAGAIDGPMPKQFFDRIMPTAGPIPPMVKDQSRIASLGPVPASAPPPPQGVTLPGPMPPAGIPPLRMSPFGNVGQEYHTHPAPPTPWQYRNETAPAAPHPGTPGSQTATVDDSQPRSWIDAVKNATGLDVETASTAVKQKTDQYFDAVRQHGLPAVKAYANQQAGQAPASVTSAGPGARNPAQAIAMAQAMMGGQPAPVEPQMSQAELMALIEAMRLKGATPEEIAYVQSLISEQTA